MIKGVTPGVAFLRRFCAVPEAGCAEAVTHHCSSSSRLSSAFESVPAAGLIGL